MDLYFLLHYIKQKPVKAWINSIRRSVSNWGGGGGGGFTHVVCHAMPKGLLHNETNMVCSTHLLV